MGGTPAAADQRTDSPAPARRDPAVADAGRAATPTAPGGASRDTLGGLAIQAKTTVGASSDPLEREADGVADRVMRAMAPDSQQPPESAVVSQAGKAVQRQPATPAVEPRPEPPSAPPGPVPTPEPAHAEPVPAAEGMTAEGAEPAGGPAGGDVSDHVQALLNTSRGRGAPLPAELRAQSEQTLGQDLAGVRIHDDQAANEAARALGALAFTRGRDIYFAAGSYDPGSEAGQRLIAHELAHVAQQAAAPGGQPPGTDTAQPIRRFTGPPAAAGRLPGPAAGDRGGAGRASATGSADRDGVIRRAPPKTGGTGGAPTKAGTSSEPPGTIDVPGKKVTLTNLPVPEFKKQAMIAAGVSFPLTVKRWDDPPRGNTQQDSWRTRVRAPVQAAVSKLISDKPHKGADTGGVHYFQYKEKAKPFYVIGTAADITERLLIPPWDQRGNATSFDVDHKLEVQLGGDDGIPLNNLWLLESSANRSAGSKIFYSIRRQVMAVLDADKTNPPYAEVRKSPWMVTIPAEALNPSGGPRVRGRPGSQWSANDVMTESAKLTDPLDRVPGPEVDRLRGSSSRLSIFSTAAGGKVRHVDMDSATGTASPKWGRDGLFKVKSVSFLDGKLDTGHQGGAGEKVGSIGIEAFKGNKITEPGSFDLDLISIAGVPYGGYVRTLRTRLAAKMFSPIEMDSLDFDVAAGFVGRGRIMPDIDLLRGKLEIGFVLDEAGPALYALITGDAFNLPGPFQVTGGLIEIRAGGLDPKFSAEGQLDFEIRKLATGYLRAKADTTGKLGMGGKLTFETSLFTKAEVEVGYADNKWSAKGELGIGEGKVRGIKKASAALGIDGDKVSAQGTFESSLKALQGGTLGLEYDPATGTKIDGSLKLGQFPGVRGGEVKAKVTKAANAEEWSLAGEVTAEPAIPGVKGSITGRYDAGAFVVSSNLGYQRGMLDGTVALTLTNQEPDGAGLPVGPPKPDLLLVYGRGRVALKLTPWLIASAEVVLRPNGSVAVAGTVALPDRFELFARRELNRRLFSVGLDIPIIGVAVAGQRIGIFATIRGGLDLVAGIGPGVLLGTGITVSYDPEREDATQVAGGTTLVVPADAGLRLFVQGAIGVGIPVVSATAGIELGGALGLLGELRAGTHILWTPSRGLVLDAEARLSVQPRFIFDVSAFVDVSADLLLTTIELYHKKWKLAGFEYGSDLRFGVVLPVHAENGVFDFSFDKMRFEYPSIDATETAKGVLRKIFD